MKSLKLYINEGIFDMTDDVLNNPNDVTYITPDMVIEWLRSNNIYLDRFKPTYDEKLIDVRGNEVYIDSAIYKIYAIRDEKFIESNPYNLKIVQVKSVEVSDCSMLDSLEGCPENVSDGFFIFKCKELKSLKGAPKEANRVMLLNNLKLESLDYCPKITKKGKFTMINTPLIKSLKGLKFAGSANEVKIQDCMGITNLSGLPKRVENLYLERLRNCKSLVGLPEKINLLFISQMNNISTLEGMPKSLYTLVIQEMAALNTFKGCPEEVKHKLDLSNLKMQQPLDKLPAKINRLRLGNVRKKANIFDGVEVKKIENTSV